MDITNLLEPSSRSELRGWLNEHHLSDRECWVVAYRGKVKPDWDALPYLDIVEEALCFGWIDSTNKKLPDGRLAQRLSPRRSQSHWTELNKRRCADLESRGLMTDAGRTAWHKTEQMMETDRIRFRPWLEKDAAVLFKYASDPEVGPRAGWPPHKSVEESREVIRKVFSNGHTWALVLKETGEPVGCMGYKPYGKSNISIGENDAELGYWIARPYWNRGLCTEALQAMIDYCFNHKGLETLWGDYFVDNPASGRVMEKCCFRDTGEVDWCRHLYGGEERPVRVLQLISTLWGGAFR